MRQKKSLLIFAAIFLLAAFLRLYRIEENFVFSGEVGHNLLAIKDAVIHRYLPLLGPPTSHPWLSFGPFFYWVYGPVLILSNFNPVSHAYFGVSMALLMLIVNYYVIKKMFGDRISLFSSFLIGISPLYMEFTRNGRFFFIVSLLIYPFIFFLYKVAQGEKKYLFWLGLVYGAMFSFHFTPLMLLPLILSVLYVRKVKLSLPEILSGIGGFLLMMLPFFIYDILHGFSMTKNVVLWIPYRIAGFFGLYPKNTASAQVIHENVVSLSQYIVKSFFPQDIGIISYGIIFGFAVYIVYRMYSWWKGEKLAFAEMLLYIWLGWGYIAVFIHGSPPIHYFVPLLPIPILLLSLLLQNIWNEKYGKRITILFLCTLALVNMMYYFSDAWYYRQSERFTVTPYYVPYVLQQKITKTIIADAKGTRFVLQRNGMDDQFEGDYAQNYIYLLWWYGNEPVNKARVIYTIDEEGGKDIDNKDSSSAFRISNIWIGRKNSL